MPNINLKKLWRRKRSVDITEYDPTYKVTYLGNVLTGWAKGEGCVEKPLATLWRNYCQSSRPDISMKVTICGAGLRAVTREHGLTEYWAHRITYCAAHPAYPRVFCWVYRHEGRRLKQELRCHAVLCPKQGKAEKMASQLQDRLSLALHEFRREKAIRQNARLSVVNAVYDVSTLPLRKFYLVTGASNYRPPLERSKSAPRLGAIEEIIEEEEEEEELEEVCEIEKRLSEESRQTIATPSSPAASTTSSQPSTSPSTPPTPPTHFDELLKMLRQPGDISTARDVALVYQQVDDSPVEVSIPQEGIVTFSSPNLMYYSRSQPPEPPDDLDLATTPYESPVLENHSIRVERDDDDDDDDLGLLESFKDKICISNGEESLTSDQPESIGSHSCSSSSCDGGGGGVLHEEEEEETEDHHRVNIKEDKISNANESRGKVLEEEDNISEESGYSEDKECIGIKV